MKNRIIKISTVSFVIVIAMLAMSTLFSQIATKNGIKSSTTGNCWDSGSQCVKPQN